MKKEYDFSKGERGKFYSPEVELNIPVYLDWDVARVVQQYAKKRKTNIGALVNERLRKDIELMSQSRKLKARYSERRNPALQPVPSKGAAELVCGVRLPGGRLHHVMRFYG